MRNVQSKQGQKPSPKKTLRSAGRRPPERSDDAHAFIPDPSEGGRPPTEDLAELLGEDFVQSATGATDALADGLEAVRLDEIETSQKEDEEEEDDDDEP